MVLYQRHHFLYSFIKWLQSVDQYLEKSNTCLNASSFSTYVSMNENHRKDNGEHGNPSKLLFSAQNMKCVQRSNLTVTWIWSLCVCGTSMNNHFEIELNHMWKSLFLIKCEARLLFLEFTSYCRFLSMHIILDGLDPVDRNKNFVPWEEWILFLV